MRSSCCWPRCCSCKWYGSTLMPNCSFCRRELGACSSVARCLFHWGKFYGCATQIRTDLGRVNGPSSMFRASFFHFRCSTNSSLYPADLEEQCPPRPLLPNWRWLISGGSKPTKFSKKTLTFVPHAAHAPRRVLRHPGVARWGPSLGCRSSWWSCGPTGRHAHHRLPPESALEDKCHRLRESRVKVHTRMSS